jgi:hypothetical protein
MLIRRENLKDDIEFFHQSIVLRDETNPDKFVHIETRNLALQSRQMRLQQATMALTFRNFFFERREDRNATLDRVT